MLQWYQRTLQTDSTLVRNTHLTINLITYQLYVQNIDCICKYSVNNIKCVSLSICNLIEARLDLSR